MTKPNLIIINGTIGVGKTWIARTLLCQLDSAAYIEGDNLGFVSEDLFKDSTRGTFALDIAAGLIELYKERGAKTLILDRLVLGTEQIESFLKAVKMPVYIFYLYANKEDIISRIKKRKRPQFESEIQDFEKIELGQRESLVANLGIEVDTSFKTPEEIVSEIIWHLQNTGSRTGFS